MVRRIFVPERIVEKHRIDALEFGFSDEVVTAEIDGLYSRGFIASMDQGPLDCMLERWKLEIWKKFPATVGNQLYESTLAECDHYTMIVADHPAEEKIDALSEELGDLLTSFGARLGLNEVGLHFITGPKEHFPPRKNRDGTLIFVIGGSPVGVVRNQRVKTLCGTLLTENGEELSLRSHSTGYGGIVKDDDGTVLAQIVDSTIYLTIPSKEERFVTLYSKQGADLFHKLIRTVWNKRGTASPPATHKLIENADIFATEMAANDVHRIKWYQMYLDTARARIEKLDREIKLEIEIMRDASSMVRAIELRQRDPKRTEKAKASFIRLKEHHLIDKIVTTDDEFFEVWTKPVILAHDGRLYGPMGPYILTFYRVDCVMIRCRDFPHLSLYVHPHVPIDTGDPCFGNATRAITEALLSDDRAHGIELVLDWLENGYDHDIAAVKVTEWPVSITT